MKNLQNNSIRVICNLALIATLVISFCHAISAENASWLFGLAGMYFSILGLLRIDTNYLDNLKDNNSHES